MRGIWSGDYHKYQNEQNRVLRQTQDAILLPCSPGSRSESHFDGSTELTKVGLGVIPRLRRTKMWIITKND